MSAHTPGPWRRSTDSSDGPMTIAAGAEIHYRGNPKRTYPEHLIVGGCGCCSSPFGVEDTEQLEANARLIASAPELLEALSMYVAVCGNTGHALSRESASELYDKAAAILAKATGAA